MCKRPPFQKKSGTYITARRTAIDGKRWINAKAPRRRYGPQISARGTHFRPLGVIASISREERACTRRMTAGHDNILYPLCVVVGSVEYIDFVVSPGKQSHGHTPRLLGPSGSSRSLHPPMYYSSRRPTFWSRERRSGHPTSGHAAITPHRTAHDATHTGPRSSFRDACDPSPPRVPRPRRARREPRRVGGELQGDVRERFSTDDGSFIGVWRLRPRLEVRHVMALTRVRSARRNTESMRLWRVATYLPSVGDDEGCALVPPGCDDRRSSIVVSAPQFFYAYGRLHAAPGRRRRSRRSSVVYFLATAQLIFLLPPACLCGPCCLSGCSKFMLFIIRLMFCSIASSPASGAGASEKS